MLFAGCLGLASPAMAQLNTTNLLLDFDANVDRDITAETNTWDSALNPGENPFEFSLDTRVGTGLESTRTNATLGAIFGIGGRLDFPRTSNQVTSERDRGTADSFDTPGSLGDISTDDATFEFWARFDNTAANQLFWETGGTTDGSAFVISGGNLQWVVKDGGASDSLSTAISADGEYHHVVAVYNRDDPNSVANPGTGDTMTLYIDGVQVGFGDTETSMEDWAGSDTAAIGGRDSATGGHTGDLGNIDNYSNFDGRVAAFRLYTAAWSSNDVNSAIAAVQARNVYFDNVGGGAGGDGRWNLGDNWDTGLAPSVNQNVIINSGLTATISNGNLGAQTLYIGATNMPGAGAPLNPVVADGAGTLNMSGGELDATQIIIGSGGNDGTLNFTDGRIDVNWDTDAADTGKQAVSILHSGAATNVFTMGTSGGGTSPTMIIGGTNRRFEIGVNEGSTADSVAIFNMESGSLTVNANIVLGQSGIDNNALAAFNIYGGDIYVRDQFNINDGNAILIQTNGTISVDDLQTMSTSGNTEDIRLLGGTFTIRDQMVDRAGNSDMTIDGGTLFFSASTAGNRKVEDITFDSGTIRYTIQDPATSPTALTILNTGTFTNSSGQLDLNIADRPGAAAFATTWTNGSAVWSAVNVGEWDAGNPIQYITNGSAYTLVNTDGSATITNIENLTSAHPDFDLRFITNSGPNADEVQIVANTNVATTPIKAVIAAGGATVTRAQNLLIGEFVGADAADLDVNAGTLDLGGNDIQVGGNADTATLTLNGGAITNVNNVNFGSGAGTEGGTIQLNGGTMVVAGDITETDVDSQTSAQLHIDGATLTVGGNISVQRFAVGQTIGSVGAYIITNGQQVTSSGTTAVGANGTGTLQIADGTLITSDGDIGEASAGYGLVTMNSTGASWIVARDLNIGNSGVGQLDLIEGTLSVGTDTVGTRGTYLAASANGTGIFNIGSPGGSTNVLFQNQGGNFEIANDGLGVVNMYGGVMQQLDDNNIVVNQGTDSDGTLNLYGGRINLLAVGGGSDVNFNNGIGVVNVTNGTLRARTINLTTSTSGSTGIVNISGGDVFLTGNIDYRSNGTRDIVNLSGGLLELSGGEIRLANSSVLAGGTNQFNFTGGTLKNVGIFIGDLVQQSADAASVLDIGASPGTMQIQGDYSLISNGFTAMLSLELFGMGTNAGTDFDFLTVVGNASLGGTVQILDQSAGAIDAATPFTWNLIEAANITTNDLFVDLPSGFFWQIDTGGATDIFQVYTIPEPSTLILLGLGALGLGLLRRRGKASVGLCPTDASGKTAFNRK